MKLEPEKKPHKMDLSSIQNDPTRLQKICLAFIFWESPISKVYIWKGINPRIVADIILYLTPICGILGITLPLIMGQPNLTILGLYLGIPMILAPIIYTRSQNNNFYLVHIEKCKFHLFIIMYFLFLTVSIILLYTYDVRPHLYFLTITIMATIILLEILLFDLSSKKSAIILLQIMALVLNIIWGVTLNYHYFISRTDPIAHSWWITNLLESGYVTNIFGDYKAFPLWHILVSSLYQVLDLSIPPHKLMFFTNGLIYSFAIPVVYLISSRIFKNEKISLLSALFLSMFQEFIIYGMSSISRSVVTFLMFILILLLFRHTKRSSQKLQVGEGWNPSDPPLQSIGSRITYCSYEKTRSIYERFHEDIPKLPPWKRCNPLPIHIEMFRDQILPTGGIISECQEKSVFIQKGIQLQDTSRIIILLVIVFALMAYHHVSMIFILTILFIIYLLQQIYDIQSEERLVTAKILVLIAVMTIAYWIYYSGVIFPRVSRCVTVKAPEGILTQSIIVTPINEVFNYLQLTPLLLYVILGCIWALKYREINALGKIFCFLGLLLTAVTFPGPALLINKIASNFNIERFGEYSMLFIVVAGAVGFYIMYARSKKYQKYLIVILFATMCFMSISNDFTASDNPLVKRPFYTYYFTDEDITTFDSIANITSGYVMGDYVTSKYIDYSAYSTKSHILEVDTKNHRLLREKSDDVILIREGELKKRPVKLYSSSAEEFILNPSWGNQVKYYYTDSPIWSTIDSYNKVFYSSNILVII